MTLDFNNTQKITCCAEQIHNIKNNVSYKLIVVKYYGIFIKLLICFGVTDLLSLNKSD